MSSCPRCSEPIHAAVATCRACGADTGQGQRRRAVVARVGLAVLSLALVGTIAGPVYAGLRSRACEPSSWADWHRAIERSCLTPSYVCEHMTSAKMLEDPAVVEGLRRALEAGESAPLADVQALVAHLRAAYGCEPSGSRRGGPAGRGAPVLPPGHPPLQGAPAAPTFAAPGALTI